MKFASRMFTGAGAIERLCGRIQGRHTLRVEENSVEFDSREVRTVVWRIGAPEVMRTVLIEDTELRLSVVLANERATIIDSAREYSTNDTTSCQELVVVADEITSDVSRKKKM